MEIEHSEDQENQKAARKQRHYWTELENAQLLQCILMNPKEIIDRIEQRKKLVSQICKYIKSVKSDKNEKNCRNKLKKLLNQNKKFGQLVEKLKKSAGVSEEWFKEKQLKAKSKGINLDELYDAEIWTIKQFQGEDVIWNEEENKKLLEFIILHQDKVLFSTGSKDTIEPLQNHLQSNKTFKQCLTKLAGLFESFTLDKVIINLAKKAKVDDKWIQERKSKKSFIHLKDFEDQIKAISANQSILQKAMELFVQSPDFFKALAIKQLIKPNSLLLELPRDHLTEHVELSTPKAKNIEFQGGNETFASKKSISNDSVNQSASSFQNEEPEGRIVMFRYCLFLAKYRKQFEETKLQHLTNSLFQKLSEFTKSQNQVAWRKYHYQSMKKHQNIENFISNNLKNLYVTQQEFDQQILRIQSFYAEHLAEEMNSFASKRPRLVLQSSNEEVDCLVETITREIAELQKKEHSNQTDSNEADESFKTFETSIKPKIIIKIPVQLQMSFSKIQDELNFDKKTEGNPKVKSQATMKESHQSRKVPQKEIHNFSKRQQLLEKKITKDDKKLKEMREKEFDIVNQGEKRSDLSIQSAFLSVGALSKLVHFFLNEASLQESFGNKKQERSMSEPEQEASCLIDNEREDKIEFDPSKDEKNTFAKEKSVKSSWSLSERLKMLTLLSFHSQEVIDLFAGKKESFLREVSNWIGQQKSREQVAKYFYNNLKGIKNRRQESISEVVESEKERYCIKEGFLQGLRSLGEKYRRKIETNVRGKKFLLTFYPLLIKSQMRANFETTLRKMFEHGPLIGAKFEGDALENESEIKVSKCQGTAPEIRISVDCRLKYKNEQYEFKNQKIKKIEFDMILILYKQCY